MSHHETRREDGNVEAPDSDMETVKSAHDRRSSTRSFLIGLVSILLAFVGAAVLLKVFFAERVPDLTAERLEAARRTWHEHGPESYDLDLEIRGARPGAAHVEVRGGVVTGATRDGREPPRWTWDEWTVPGQFDTLQRELELAEDPQHEMQAAAGTQLRLRCDFDPELGFPRRYHRFATGGAPEVFWRVTRFVDQEKGE